MMLKFLETPPRSIWTLGISKFEIDCGSPPSKLRESVAVSPTETASRSKVAVSVAASQRTGSAKRAKQRKALRKEAEAVFVSPFRQNIAATRGRSHSVEAGVGESLKGCSLSSFVNCCDPGRSHSSEAGFGAKSNSHWPKVRPPAVAARP